MHRTARIFLIHNLFKEQFFGFFSSLKEVLSTFINLAVIKDNVFRGDELNTLYKVHFQRTLYFLYY